MGDAMPFLMAVDEADEQQVASGQHNNAQSPNRQIQKRSTRNVRPPSPYLERLLKV